MREPVIWVSEQRAFLEEGHRFRFQGAVDAWMPGMFAGWQRRCVVAAGVWVSVQEGLGGQCSDQESVGYPL